MVFFLQLFQERTAGNVAWVFCAVPATQQLCPSMKETQNTESNQINHPLASRFLYLTPDSWGKENCSLYAGSPVPVPLKHIIPTSNELWIRTSKTPRQRPRLPLAPASSCTSLNAATRGSSVGSIPPPGTIHSPCLRLAVTSNTCHAPANKPLHRRLGSLVVRRSPTSDLRLSGLKFDPRPPHYGLVGTRTVFGR